ncbi:hypothetical protein TSUD_120110 [Trifolium subterraneum]|uniref:F-box domain-containing protein n=1 Tax=Trifolium subterraneum TaxID=3900 RepID=A0A1B5Z7C9_TRISU|nr:hypothetical protein TSUD_120110 [Trifolium subterraneum]
MQSLENHGTIYSNSEVPVETMEIERHNYDEKEEDRLSDLPDCLLIHMLSFLNAKQAVQTCILSTRWNNLWKHLTTLLLFSSHFDNPDGFTEFATQILSLRDDSTALYTLAFATTKPPLNLLSWLRELTEIKSLTVTSTTLEVLSLYPNLLKVKLHCFRNLKSLRVKMKGISSGSYKTLIDGRFVQLSVKYRDEVDKFREAMFKEGSPAIPNGIVGFLLRNSPLAKVHIIK